MKGIFQDTRSPELKHTRLQMGHKATGLVKLAHKYNLKVHPYTVRKDSLPAYAGTMEELLTILFDDLKVNGVFTDFGDIAVKYLN